MGTQQVQNQQYVLPECYPDCPPAGNTPTATLPVTQATTPGYYSPSYYPPASSQTSTSLVTSIQNPNNGLSTTTVTSTGSMASQPTLGLATQAPSWFWIVLAGVLIAAIIIVIAVVEL